MVTRWPLQRRNRATRPTTRETSPVHCNARQVSRHDVELVVAVLSGLGQLRSDIEFLVLIESQAFYVRGLELLREVDSLRRTHGRTRRGAGPST
jgi:hypothetical protein